MIVVQKCEQGDAHHSRVGGGSNVASLCIQCFIVFSFAAWISLCQSNFLKDGFVMN